MLHLHGRTIAIIGDSHMQALGPRLKPLLEQRGADVVRVKARPGWSLEQYLASGDLPGLVDGCDTVLVELGGNDRAQDTAYQDMLRSALRVFGDRTVLWVGPSKAITPPTSTAHAATRDMQAAYLPGRVTRWIDSASATGTEHRADGVHYTPAGYDLWTRAIMDNLTDGFFTRLLTLLTAGLTEIG